MTTENILWIIVITIIALLVVVFQYFFKAKRTSKITVLFAFLRFLSVFIILLLLVDPKIIITNSKKEKPELTVLVDQSQSISYLEQEEQVKNILSKITLNKPLQNKFEVSLYGFGDQIVDSLSYKFKDKQTKIAQSLATIQKVHRKQNSPMVIISDGNQTYGQDYSYYKSKFNQPIYSIPLGDTTQIADLYINTVNANKYVFLNNEFPMEILANYTGNKNQSANLVIYRGKQKVFSKKLLFTKIKRSHFINPKLKAIKVGIQNYKITLLPFVEEKTQ